MSVRLIPLVLFLLAAVAVLIPNESNADCNSELRPSLKASGFSDDETNDLLQRVCNNSDVQQAVGRLDAARQKFDRTNSAVGECLEVFDAFRKMREIRADFRQNREKSIRELFDRYRFLESPWLDVNFKFAEVHIQARNSTDVKGQPREINRFEPIVTPMQMDSTKCFNVHGKDCFLWWSEFKKGIVFSSEMGLAVKRQMKAIWNELNNKFAADKIQFCYLGDFLELAHDGTLSTVLIEDQEFENQMILLDRAMLRRSSPALTNPEMRVKVPVNLPDRRLKNYLESR